MALNGRASKVNGVNRINFNKGLAFLRRRLKPDSLGRPISTCICKPYLTKNGVTLPDDLVLIKVRHPQQRQRLDSMDMLNLNPDLRLLLRSFPVCLNALVGGNDLVSVGNHAFRNNEQPPLHPEAG